MRMNLIALAACLGVCGFVFATDFSQFDKVSTLSFPGYTGTSALQNFPVLVRVGAHIGGFAYTDMSFPATGADLRFSDMAGTELAYEIDTWDPQGTSLVWVKVPVFQNTAQVRMYYGNAAAEVPAYSFDGTVWSNEFAGVWHANDDLKDSTGHGLTGTRYTVATTNVTEGPLGRSLCAVNPGGMDVANYDHLIPNEAYFTISAWLRTATNNVSGLRIFSRKYDYQEITGFDIFTWGNEEVGVRGGAQSTSGYAPRMTTCFKNSSTWFHFAVVYDGNVARVYTNGVDTLATLKTPSPTFAPATESTRGLSFLHPPGNANSYLRAYIDEMRLAKTTLSGDRLRADYATVAQADFVSYGAVQANDSIPLGIASLSAADISGTSAGMVYRLQVGSSAPTVYADWGTDPGALSETVVIGPVSESGTYTNTLSDLLPGTTYYYRHRAADATESAESSVAVPFITLGEPALGVTAASNVFNVVHCSVYFLKPGFSGTTVKCLFGTSPDALEVTNVWESVTEPGWLECALPQAQYGGTYYYAFVASCPSVGGDLASYTLTNSIIATSTLTWTGALSTDWSTPDNWFPATVPTAATDTFFPNAGSSIRLSENSAAYGFVANTEGTVDLDLGGFSLNSTNLVVGTNKATVASIRNGSWNVSPGNLRIGVVKEARDCLLTVADGATITATTLQLGNYSPSGGNKLVIDDGGIVSLTSGLTLGPNNSAGSNQIHVLRGGLLLIRGNTQTYTRFNDFVVDGGIVTNIIGQFSNACADGGRTPSTVEIKNGGVFRMTGGNYFHGNGSYSGRVSVIDGGLLKIDTRLQMGSGGADQGGYGLLFVSNAVVEVGDILKFPGDSRFWSETMRVVQYPGDVTRVTTGGDFGVGMGDNGKRDDNNYRNTGSRFEIDGGTVAVGKQITIGGIAEQDGKLIPDFLQYTNNTFSVKGASTRITAQSWLMRLNNYLNYVSPAGGFADVPIEITNDATFDPTTTLTIDLSELPKTQGGRFILFKAGTLADNSIPLENVTVLGGETRKWELLQEGNTITFKIASQTAILLY